MSIRITGMNSGLDTDKMVQELVSAYDKKKETYKGEQKKLGWKTDAWKELNTKIKSFVTKSLSNMRFSGNYTKKKTVISNSNVAGVVTSDNAVNGRQTLEVIDLAQSCYKTGDILTAKDENGVATGEKVTRDTKLSALGFSGSGTINLTKENGAGEPIGITVRDDMTVGEFVNVVANAGLNANFDEANGRIFINSSSTGLNSNFTLAGADVDGKGAAALAALGLDDAHVTTKAGANAKIILNDVEFISDSNTFTINGLTITAREKTNGEIITLSTETDYDEIYDSIKSFIKEYNSLINQMDKLYNAESADNYDMLTDEEKEAMSEDEVKTWEDKIKSALLRRDENLSTLTRTMREAMLETYDLNGTTYSLSSFGINTLSYFLAADNEKNAYHIDGDPDDGDTAGEKDKLKAAIASNPDAVMGFFQKLATNMYNNMSKLSSSNEYRSYGNYYDDKKLDKEDKQWNEKISKYEDYVAQQEEKYYKQFTAMEKAMGELQSQQTYLSQLMG